MCSFADPDLFNPQIFMEHLMCARHCARDHDRYDPCPPRASVLVGEIDMLTNDTHVECGEH